MEGGRREEGEGEEREGVPGVEKKKAEAGRAG
jgi:hypothetical protein